MAYESTSVPVERSQSEIRVLLTKHRAQKFAFGEELGDDGAQWAAVSFEAQGLVVRIRVPHKPIDAALVARKLQRARTRTALGLTHEMKEQEARRIWRVLSWNLKARLVAVEEEVETFAEAFLAHIVNPSTGRTMYDSLVEDGRIELPTGLLALPAGNS
jgi:hypothetical protein